MKTSMSEPLLIEEAGDCAMERLYPLLTLVVLAFDAGEAAARALVDLSPQRIIDPVASACFREARELLLRPAPNAEQARTSLFAALFALDVAASREPESYGPSQQALRNLVLEALDQIVGQELATCRDLEECAHENEQASR